MIKHFIDIDNFSLRELDLILSTAKKFNTDFFGKQLSFFFFETASPRDNTKINHIIQTSLYIDQCLPRAKFTILLRTTDLVDTQHHIAHMDSRHQPRTCRSGRRDGRALFQTGRLAIQFGFPRKVGQTGA